MPRSVPEINEDIFLELKYVLQQLMYVHGHLEQAVRLLGGMEKNANPDIHEQPHGDGTELPDVVPPADRLPPA